MGFIAMKKCFKCGVNKELSEFYKHKMMSDGHLNKCKTCAKADVKKNRDDNIEYYQGYDAWRYQNDPKVKARHKRYFATESGSERLRAGKDAWAARNPNSRAAHIMVNNAVRDGRLHKPTNCSCCGNFTPSMSLHAHHHDYSAPLDVTWLCVGCHSYLHNSPLT